MFKKNVWVIALIAAVALAIMIGGCIEALEDDEGVEVDIVKLSEVLASAPLGVIATDDDWDAIFKETPFAKCNGTKGDGATYEIIKEGGVNKLKIWKMKYDWGEGLDMRCFDTKTNKGAGFKKGDEIEIKGTASPAGLVLNSKGEGFAKIDNWASGGTIDEKFILTADDAGNSKQKSGIRMQFDTSVAKRQGVIVLEEIYIKGKRGTGDSTAGADYSIPGGESYKVPAIPDADKNKYYYVDLNAAVKGQATGDANVTGFTEATKIEEDGLTVGFTKRGLYAFVPFDDDLKKILVDRLKNYYTLDVVIDGEGGARVEWCFGDNGGTDWDITTPYTDKAFNTQLTSTQSLRKGREVEKLGGFIVRSSNTSASGYPSQIKIKSIKITPKQPVNPITVIGKAITIAVKKPTAGSKADTSVNVTGKTSADADINGATGSIKWIPELPSDGNWAASTEYSAIITIIPNPGYYIPVLGLSEVADTTIYKVVSYNPITKEVAITFK